MICNNWGDITSVDIVAETKPSTASETTKPTNRASNVDNQYNGMQSYRHAVTLKATMSKQTRTFMVFEYSRLSMLIAFLIVETKFYN